MEIQLPPAVKTIIEQLNSCGFEAYAVGGCVRDSLLKREPKDWDVTTSAKPDQIKAVFEKLLTPEYSTERLRFCKTGSDMK